MTTFYICSHFQCFFFQNDLFAGFKLMGLKNQNLLVFDHKLNLNSNSSKIVSIEWQAIIFLNFGANFSDNFFPK